MRVCELRKALRPVDCLISEINRRASEKIISEISLIVCGREEWTSTQDVTREELLGEFDLLPVLDIPRSGRGLVGESVSYCERRLI